MASGLYANPATRDTYWRSTAWPYPVTWIVVTLALIALSSVSQRAAISLAVLALLGALLLNAKRWST